MRTMSWGTLLLGFILLDAGAVAAPRQTVSIVFTKIPPPGAGSDSRGDIAGRVTGLEKPQEYRVVLYAQTDVWYVQPQTIEPYTVIPRNGRWSNWTHLGERYAALVVRLSYRPPATTASLPSVGGDILAEAEAPATKI